MKAFGKYISKYLVSFAGIILLLVFINVIAFGWAFHDIMTKDYGAISPQAMLTETVAASNSEGISEEAAENLKAHHIWAIYLDINGNKAWEVNCPEEIPDHFTIRDVARFTKGYLADYPVFVWNTEDGLLLLGYPKDSYVKITGNYFSIRFIQALPLFITVILTFDFAILFTAYFFSKRKILRSTEPIITSIEALSNGKPAALSIGGELSEVANSVNKASRILSKQNEARANWISGISHDIRTPLSMIMGYADRIAKEENTNSRILEEAEIISRQSIKIKELVQDLNLVSQLEYEMQPLNKKPVRLAGLLRSYTADLLNTGLPDIYTIQIETAPAAEAATLNCDARLISRAINNLIQNSIRHNPDGCDITLRLDYTKNIFTLSVSDNGVGLSDDKLRELEVPHYMESADQRLDLRHGLGIILVRQIVSAHNGKMQIKSKWLCGYQTILLFPQKEVS